MILKALIVLVAGVVATHPASNPNGKILEINESQTRVASPKIGRPPMQRPEVRYFTTGGNLYSIEGKDTLCIAQGGNGIVFGETVSRNEFGINGGIFPAEADQDYLAFYRKDESRVTQFPLLDISSRTGTLKNIRYPMNGMTSEQISLGIYNAKNHTTRFIKADDYTEERYLTGVSWGGTTDIYIQVMDRSQHSLKLNQYRASDGSFVRTILTEENDAWIETKDGIHFFDATGKGPFIYTTDNRDGYTNLYLCDTLGTVRRLTCTDADVAFAGIDGDYVYYISAEPTPIESQLFRIKVSSRKNAAKAKIGKPERITKEPGCHNIMLQSKLSEDGSKYVIENYFDTYSEFNNPGWSRSYSLDGKMLESFAENDTDPLAPYASCEVELGTVPAADGVTENYYRLFKPLNFDPSKKYPVIVYVYGGPHSQMVTDAWLGSIRMWEMAMAQRGYVVYVQDNRGTSNRGAAFEKAINRRCGQIEMEDQIAGLNYMLDKNPWMDRDRIGVHGWSYGGFMTITLSANHPELFKVAVAGGPVIDWKWYEIMYGERYMDTPRTNPEGFAETSLINKAKDLKTRLLICQGAIDDTVVWEHSLSFVQECIMNGVQLDYFPYPMDKHNMAGQARLHLYNKITQYFQEHL